MADAQPFSEEDLKRLCDFLYRRTGMVFNESKRYYVQRRLDDRMAATRTASFEAYFAHLRTDAADEIEHFINAFTINETYFYREDYQLQCLSRDLLRERLQATGGKGGVRIWSAPCSTGEEPYSIAMWLLENWPHVDDHEIEIVGSDIDTRVLETAREGLYSKRALMRLSAQLVERFFHREGEESWRILDDLRDSVRFTSVNLLDSVQTRAHGLFDVIFCRNVLIYFDEASRRLAADNLFENLAPGGFICLGHSESMSRISPLFEVRRFGDAIVYQKPLETARG